MKKCIKIIVLLCIVLIMCAVSFACKGKDKDKDGDNTVNDTLYSFSISADNLTLYMNEQGQQITYSAFIDKVATEAEVVWTTSDSSVAVVENGFIKPVSLGTAIISATWNGITKQCVVNVSNLYVPYISINYEKLGFIYGISQAIQIESEIFYIDSYYDITDYSPEYQIVNTSVATVSDSGLVVPQNVGETVLKVKARFNGASLEKQIPITVFEDVETHIYLKDGESTSIYENEFVYKDKVYKTTTAFGYTVKYADETEKLVVDTDAQVQWISTNTGAVSIDASGNASAVSSGSSTIYCTYQKNGKTYSSEKIEVNVAPYLLIEKFDEIKLGFNRKKANSINKADVFGNEDVSIIGVYVKGSNDNIYNDNSIDVSHLSLGNYDFIIETNKGIAYNINAVVFEVDDNLTVSVYDKNGVYFWSPDTDAGGETEYQKQYAGKNTIIYASIDVGDGPKGTAITYYWVFNLTKDEVWELLQDGYVSINVEFYADWEGTNSKGGMFYAMGQTVLYPEKATWTVYPLDLQIIYDNYDAILSATEGGFMFRMATVDNVNKYYFAISQISLIRQTKKYAISTASDLNLASTSIGEEYYLTNDITLDLVSYNSGEDLYGISKLNAPLDLNGHKITINVDVDNEWRYANVKFIKEITEKGALKNGIIEFNYNGHDLAMNPEYKKGLLVDVMNGRLENIEIIGSITPVQIGDGLFGRNSKGVFKNVVIKAKIDSVTKERFGIFENGFDGFSDVTIKDCIFLTNINPVAESIEIGTPITDFSSFTNTDNLFYGTSGEYIEANFDLSSFDTDIWTNTANGLPIMSNVVFYISSGSELKKVYIGDYVNTYVLVSDISMTVDSVIIPQLYSTIDLNGHTITLNITVSGVWDEYKFIDIIGSTGKLTNGKIVLNYISESATSAIGSHGVAVNKNNGLVKDVEFEATFSGNINQTRGLFGSDATGTFDNVDVYMAGNNTNYYGIFSHYNDEGELGNITVKDCDFICYNAYFASFYIGNTPATLESIVNNTNSTVVYYVDSVAGLNAISSVTDRKYQLADDLTINLNETGTVISSLATELDLNGHTLTISFTAGEWDNTTAFIYEITSTGKITNGKIVFNHTLNSAYVFQIGRIVYLNNGLIKDIEIDATFSGNPTMATGLFNSNVSGTFENVVIQSTGTGTAYFGIFHNDETVSAFGNAVVKNCIFIGNACELAGRWSDQSPTVLDSITNNDNSVYASGVADYTVLDYDTSSFDSTKWSIDNDTKLPTFIVK